MTNVLKIAKLSLRVISDAYDEEIKILIRAGIKDLEASGIITHVEKLEDGTEDISDELIIAALVAYIKLRFGEPEDVDKKQELYDSQKRQLMYTSGYTKWRKS